MAADGGAPRPGARPDGGDLFAPGRPAPPSPGAPPPADGPAVDPGPPPRTDPPRRPRHTVEPRVSPAHRAPPPTGGARPGAALAIALGLGLAALGVAVTGAGPEPDRAPAAGAPPTASATSTNSEPTLAAVSATAPAELRATEVALPTVAVRSRLVELDVGAGGALQAPADPAVAGWYVRGAAPGEPGPTVIAGHVDSRSGPAVFHRLDELAPGDRVEVTRSDGRVFAYRVATVEQHPKDAFPTARVYGPTPGPELRLITCGGDFDRRSRHYRDNVVVTAVPE